jgi:protein TonB
VPIASEDEDIMDDVTIEDTDFFEFDDDMAPPPPPPPEEEEIPPFLPLEDQPKIIGGLDALYKHLKYPEIARKAGIEGTVIISALIGKTGQVEQIRVDKSLGNNGCDEAAINAVKQVKFTPAKQRGRPVKFWYSFPIKFKLTGDR